MRFPSRQTSVVYIRLRVPEVASESIQTESRRLNARIPVLLLALSVIAVPVASQAQPLALNSCNNAVRTILERVEAKYAATKVLTEANHARYKTLHAAVRPGGSTMTACQARRADLVALEAALAEMIAEPKAGDRLRGGVIVDVTEGGKHGLVAFPEDQPGLLRTLGPTGVRVAGMSSADAVNSCNNFVGGGFSDWYLPSHEELVRTWKQRAVIGHFRDNWVYWTSSWYAGMRQTVTWDGGGWGYTHGHTEIGNLPAARCVRKF